MVTSGVTYRGEVVLRSQALYGMKYHVEVLTDGVATRLDPAPSQAIRNHSPDGFAWGYGGSGPAQLALALLLHATGDPELAQRHYQRFKFRFVGTWGQGKVWSMSQRRILKFVADVEADQAAAD